MAKDYYETLGIAKTASKEEIKKAYKKLAKKHHPDLNKGNKDSEQKFKEINEAASVLGDDQKRAQYDQYGSAEGFQGFDSSQFGGFGGGFNAEFDFGDIFDMFFGGGRRGSNRSRRGNDLIFDLTITLEDAYKGLNKKITMKASQTCLSCKGAGAKSQKDIETCSNCNGQGMVRVTKRTPFGLFAQTRTCPTCRGERVEIKNPCNECDGDGRLVQKKTLEVEVPAGAVDGTKLRITGEGEAGFRGGGTGDLYIEIHVEPHKIFVREGADLYADVKVPYMVMVLGGEIEVPFINGIESLKIPKGTQDSHVFTFRSRGLPRLNGFGTGAAYLKVVVDVPTKVTKKQAELLKEFEELHSGKNKKGWFT